MKKDSYLDSHPWLSFKVNLSTAPPALWVHLGEARSKIEHIEGAALRPETADRLHRLFLAKGVRATTAIEGNTLTEEQVLDRLEGKLELPPSQEYLGQEIDNILRAVNDIAATLLDTGPVPLELGMIKEFNREVLQGLPLEEGVIPGEIPAHSVVVGKYVGAPAGDCEYLLERLVEWLNGPDFAPPATDSDMKLVYAVVKAVMAHLYLAWIHPFGDGNGRASRLVEFQILVSSGVPFPAAHLLSNHYNLTRAEYYRQLDRSSKAGGDVIPFLGYAVQGFVDGLREQIKLIRAQQWDVAWENYVYDAFKGEKGPAADRQRALVLALGDRIDEAVPKSELRELTPRVAELFAGKTGKTLTRDVNVLKEMDLVDELGRGRFRARTEIVLAFLPAKVAEPPREVPDPGQRGLF